MERTNEQAGGGRGDEARSLALHSAVARKLRSDPAMLLRARARLTRWMAGGGRSMPLWRRWEAVLSRPAEDVTNFLCDASEEAAWLRKASPFAGELSPAERWAILRSMRSRRGDSA
jgi:hypothetical protein